MKLKSLLSYSSWNGRIRGEVGRVRRITSKFIDIIRIEFNLKADQTTFAKDPFCSQRNHLAIPQSVIDVGGSHGQFAREIIKYFPNANIYSFEPIPECFTELQILAEQYPQIHPSNIALSDCSGKQVFYVSSFNDSSSFQKIRTEHTDAWPHTIIKHKIIAVKERLDDFINLSSLQPPIFVKIDVQGHEMFVIEGGRKIISQSQRVMIECNFVNLYEGQPTFDQLYQAMRDMGFMFDGMISPLHHPRSGELMSADLIFYKK